MFAVGKQKKILNYESGTHYFVQMSIEVCGTHAKSAREDSSEFKFVIIGDGLPDFSLLGRRTHDEKVQHWASRICTYLYDIFFSPFVFMKFLLQIFFFHYHIVPGWFRKSGEKYRMLNWRKFDFVSCYFAALVSLVRQTLRSVKIAYFRPSGIISVGPECRRKWILMKHSTIQDVQPTRRHFIKMENFFGLLFHLGFY